MPVAGQPAVLSVSLNKERYISSVVFFLRSNDFNVMKMSVNLRSNSALIGDKIYKRLYRHILIIPF